MLVSGHLDSWDVGQGAMDDGGGAFVSWEALSLLKDLGKYLPNSDVRSKELHGFLNFFSPSEVTATVIILSHSCPGEKYPFAM